MQPAGQNLITYAITAIVIAVVFAIRWRRMSREMPLKLERLWILPAVYLAVVVVTFSQFPPVGWGWAFCGIALMSGAALGWQRGKLMRITVNPQTHALSQTSSPAAVLFILVLVVVRMGAKTEGASMLHLNAMAVTDMLMALALGLFTMQRIEMYLRARRLLTTARRGVLT